MYEIQMILFKHKILSPLLCGVQEGYTTQLALLRLVESYNKSVDNRGVSGTILTDLSKTFDCLNLEILIAKLNAYGFSRSALLLVYSYLTGRKQRVKVNNTFSTRRVLL